MSDTDKKIADYIDGIQTKHERKENKELLKKIHKQTDAIEEGLRYTINAKTGEISRDN